MTVVNQREESRKHRLGWSAMAVVCVAAMLTVSTSAFAKGSVLIPLPHKPQVAVLSEGDLESASIGTYTVTVYKDKELMDLVGGITLPRNGSVFQDNGKPHITFANVTRDGAKELIVSQFTAGSGDYVAVDALRIDAHGIKRVACVQTDSKHDVVALLKKLKPADRLKKCANP